MLGKPHRLWDNQMFPLLSVDVDGQKTIVNALWPFGLLILAARSSAAQAPKSIVK